MRGGLCVFPKHATFLNVENNNTSAFAKLGGKIREALGVKAAVPIVEGMTI